MVEASTEFRKNSFNDSDSATLARVATMFQNVSDEAISAGDSASFIIAQMKAFNIDASNAEHIINAVNAVSNNYAVSSGQLAQNLGNMSAALAVGNNSFEESLALLTAGTEVTRNASKVSRALVSVQSRLNQVIDDTSSTGQALTEWYKEHNIAIYDQQGQLRSLYDVLTDVAKQWPELTKNEQAYYLNQQAGSNQSQNLAAILSNFETALKATDTALNSAGSAMKENAAYQESLEFKTQSLKAEFQDFANNVLEKEVVGAVLDVSKSLLGLVNNDIGTGLTRILALGAGFTGLVGIIGQTAGKMYEVSHAIKAMGDASSGLQLLTSGKFAIIVGVAVAAIAGLVEIIRAIKGAYEDAHKSFEQMSDDLAQTQSNIESVESEIENYNKKLRELDEIDVSDRSLGWSEERTEIELNKQSAEAYLEVLRQIEAAQTGKIAGAGNYITGYKASYVGSYSDGYIGSEASEQLPITESQLKAITAEYTSQQEAVMSVALALKEYIVGWDELEGMSVDETTEELSSQLSALGINITAITETVENSFDKISDLAEKADGDFSNLTKSEQEQATKYLSDYQGYVNGLIAQSNALSTLQKSEVQDYLELTAAQNGYVLSSQNVVDKISIVANTMGITAAEAADLLIQTGQLDSANRAATQGLVLLSNGMYAAKERCAQLEDGTWKLKDTIEQLDTTADDAGESLGKTLTDSLFDVNNNLTETAKQALSTNSALGDLALAELQAQQQAAQANYNQLIEQIRQVGSQAMLSGQALSQMMALAGVGTGTYQDERDLKRTYAYKFKKSAESDPEGYNRWLTQYLTQAASSKYEQQMKEIEERMSSLISVGIGATTSSGGASRSTGKSAAEKAAEEAAAAAKQAWENQKQKELYFLKLQQAEIQSNVDAAKAEVDDYKAQLDNITKAQEAEVAAIKKELEDQLKIIQDQKDALDKWQDAIDEKSDDISNLIDYNQEYADKQIDNLEKEKDAIQETIDAINDKYDKQIEALETTNSELDKEIEREKLLKALADARAKKTLVFKNGRFSYEQDIEAIGTAQAALDKFDREQQIEKEKELIEENRKNELQYSKDEQAALDAEIERWKKYKEGWANLISDYNYQQNALLASQKYGMNLESQTWTQRLNNVNKFADAYADIMAQQAEVNKQQTALQEEQARLQEVASARQEEVTARMQEQYNQIDALMQQAQARYEQYQEQLKNIKQDISDKEGESYTDLPRVLKSVNGSAPSDAKVGDYIVTGGGIFQITGGYPGGWQSSKITGTKFSDVASAKNWLSSMGYQFQYANGSLSTHGGISLVGENGPELRVTKSGDGILPSNITKNLWSWGRLDPDKALGIDKLSNLGNLIFNNANLSFPNITSGGDARLFVENLKNLAYQYAFAR